MGVLAQFEKLYRIMPAYKLRSLFLLLSQVRDIPKNLGSSAARLRLAVKKVVRGLKKEGLLSGETVGPLFTSLSNKLNSQSDESEKDNRQKVTSSTAIKSYI